MRVIANIIRAFLLVASVALCIIAAVGYILRPDSLAGLTFWPVWAWAVPGVSLALLAWTRKGRDKRAVVVVVLLWLAYIAALAEEPRSIVRPGGWPSQQWVAARQRGAAIRVISINCSIANANAAQEVIPYHPDIVLLQESPVDRDIHRLAHRLYGKDAGVAIGHDTAIIARGEVTKEFPLRSGRELKGLHTRFYTRARVKTPSGFEVDVVSVHLIPPVLRGDPWSRSYWTDYTGRRRTQRGQMQMLVRALNSVPDSTPLVAGGDYNAPAGDASFRLLEPRLRDAFKQGGQGWCNTVLNEFPISRIDQVWVSRQFTVASVVARRTKNSDHRMVICDLLLPMWSDS